MDTQMNPTNTALQPPLTDSDSITELVKQKQIIDGKIAAIAQAKRNEALAQIRHLMAEHNLTMADIDGPTGSANRHAKKAPHVTKKVPAKYRDPKTGITWSGRGLTPLWLRNEVSKGAQRNDFLLAKS